MTGEQANVQICAAKASRQRSLISARFSLLDRAIGRLPLSGTVTSRTIIEYSYKINFCDISVVPVKLAVAQLLLVNEQVF